MGRPPRASARPAAPRVRAPPLRGPNRPLLPGYSGETSAGSAVVSTDQRHRQEEAGMRLRCGMTLVLVAALTAIAAPAALANYVYWPNIGGTSIGRMALDGSQLNNNFIDTPGTVSTDELHAVALDSKYLYWAHGNSTTGAIGRAKLDGTDVQPSFIPHAAGVNDPYGIALTPTSIYWVSSNGSSIGRADINGANPNPSFILDPPSSHPCGLATDGKYLYFSSYPSGSPNIARVPLAGGTPDDHFIPVPNGK